jgi:S-adenosylhomocysteine hydrolase
LLRSRSYPLGGVGKTQDRIPGKITCGWENETDKKREREGEIRKEVQIRYELVDDCLLNNNKALQLLSDGRFLFICSNGFSLFMMASFSRIQYLFSWRVRER